MSGTVAGANRDSLAAPTRRPDAAGETDDRDGRAHPDHRSLNSLTDTSIAVRARRADCAFANPPSGSGTSRSASITITITCSA